MVGACIKRYWLTLYCSCLQLCFIKNLESLFKSLALKFVMSLYYY